MNSVPGPHHGSGRRRRWRRAFALTALVATATLAAGCGGDGEDASTTPLAVTDVTGPDGTTVSTGEWVGEPLVINFWYSTCPPCAQELADFAEVDAERDDVRFIGVNPLDSVDDMIDFAAERGVEYDLFRDEVAELQVETGVASFPATVFVDADGQITNTTGVLDADELRGHIDDLLAGETGSSSDAPATADEAPSAGDWNGIVRDPMPQVGVVELPVVTDPETRRGFAARPGGVSVVYFGFTSCPDVCPTTMADLAVAVRMLGDDAERVDTILVSVDPDRDRDSLDAYVNAFVPDSVGLLTDDDELLRAAAAPFGADWEVRVLDDGTVEVDHTAFLYAVDDQGHLVVSWPFGTPSDLMAADLTRLLDSGDTA